MKPLDKVAEAYYGGMGDQFSRKTRERIHWICSMVTGRTVLDVGCSQGITELILGKEGKQAVGIDIEESSIAYANNALQNESEAVKRNVSYFVSSIFDFESEKKFDTVILTEVMEHFTSSASLLEKVKSLLVSDGRIIITVPFGINDYFDHKKTYYLLNLLEEVEPYFNIVDIKFFGKWIGVVGQFAEAESSKSTVLPRELIKQLEAAFYTIERPLVDELNAKVTLANQLNEKLKEGREQLVVVKSENEKKLKEGREQLVAVQSENEQLKKDNEKLKRTNKLILTENNEDQEDEYLDEIHKLQADLKSYKAKAKELEGLIEIKNKELLERLNSEELTLRKYEDSIFDYNQLEAKFANISKKYNLLSNAKLGRLTLKYWKYRKRIPQDF